MRECEIILVDGTEVALKVQFNFNNIIKSVVNQRSMEMRLLILSVILCSCHMITAASSRDQPLSPQDAEFCKGGLKVIYPGLVIDKCLIVPQKVREEISKEWGPPQVQLPSAEEEMRYTLLMVDPDAPSRNKPSRAHWRHWLMVDIKMDPSSRSAANSQSLAISDHHSRFLTLMGKALQKGDIRGTELSEYQRPTPPQGTGLHRYQFLLFEQPEGQSLSLSPQEKSSLGNWDPQAFVQRFGLAGPVASLQFLTQNHYD